MRQSKFLIFMSLILAVALVAWSSGNALAEKKVTRDDVAKKLGKVPPSELKAAAKRAAELGLKPGVAGLAPTVLPLPGIEGPGGIPHYFGPYGNWAFSPLPKGPVATVTLVDGGIGYNNPIVTISDAYGTGSGAGGITATVDANGAVVLDLTAFLGGANYSAPVVTIEDDPGKWGPDR